jgi:hypothetical protein
MSAGRLDLVVEAVADHERYGRAMFAKGRN